MRMLMTVNVDNEAGNRALKDGTLPKVVGKFVETYKPEASYFTAANGSRMAYFVVDLPDVSQMPAMAEPFWLALNAKIEMTPLMNYEDLGRGIQTWMQSQ